MLLDVTGQGVKIGDALNKHIKNHIEVVKKLLPHAIDMKVIFKKISFNFHAKITINPGIKHNIFLSGDADAHDPYDAFSQALKKIEGKIRRYSSHLHKKYTANTNTQLKNHLKKDGVTVNSYIVHYDHEDEMIPNIKNKDITKLQTMSLLDAIMHIDFSSQTILVFVNEKNQRITTLTKQNDGSFSCVEI
ncbi:hypothetical protein CAXC1_60013 [Candidatus Xenohaliotis californiensis]|uniref:Ribosomal subunit interface protein n=1 Tax=Candidatus Xenohaliotis californiensis TaxID=84677 RepID=A0ABP0EU34_9RICK|nr:hypothetical protein CAXC1_60013 [Candidatus Xenohaliotis californiensis]